MRHTVVAAALALVITSGLAIGSMTMCGDTPGFCPNPPNGGDAVVRALR